MLIEYPRTLVPTPISDTSKYFFLSKSQTKHPFAFKKYEDLPVLTNMKPHGLYVMDDLNRLGGTSVLIIVVVLIDFMAQVQSHMMSSQYAYLMKKANLKNYKR